MPSISEEERRAQALIINRTYWILPCLEVLCDIPKATAFFKTHSKEPLSTFARGYSLAIVLLFGTLLDTLVDWNPFDIDDDLMVSRAYQGDVPYERMVADSQLGLFIQKIVSLYTPLFRPVSLAELEEKVRPIVN